MTFQGPPRPTKVGDHCDRCISKCYWNCNFGNGRNRPCSFCIAAGKQCQRSSQTIESFLATQTRQKRRETPYPGPELPATRTTSTHNSFDNAPGINTMYGRSDAGAAAMSGQTYYRNSNVVVPRFSAIGPKMDHASGSRTTQLTTPAPVLNSSKAGEKRKVEDSSAEDLTSQAKLVASREQNHRLLLEKERIKSRAVQHGTPPMATASRPQYPLAIGPESQADPRLRSTMDHSTARPDIASLRKPQPGMSSRPPGNQDSTRSSVGKTTFSAANYARRQRLEAIQNLAIAHGLPLPQKVSEVPQAAIDDVLRALNGIRRQQAQLAASAPPKSLPF